MTVVVTSILLEVDILCLLCVRSFMYVVLEVDNVISPVLQIKKTKVLYQGHTVGKWSPQDRLIPKPILLTTTGVSCPKRPQGAGSAFRGSNWLYVDRSFLTPQSEEYIRI